MNAEAKTLSKLGSYALFMACNEIGTTHGKEISEVHRALYGTITTAARDAHVNTLGERIAWDDAMHTEVRRHFAQHQLAWEAYRELIHTNYNTGDFDEIQAAFKLA